MIKNKFFMVNLVILRRKYFCWDIKKRKFSILFLFPLLVIVRELAETHLFNIIKSKTPMSIEIGKLAGRWTKTLRAARHPMKEDLRRTIACKNTLEPRGTAARWRNRCGGDNKIHGAHMGKRQNVTILK